jgi:hypothetical protein
MLRRLVLVLMLLAGLAAAPLARASQACCEHGCDLGLPACVAACALCASAAVLPAPEPAAPATAPARVGPAAPNVAFDDWIDEIWNPPD